jgi:hypothetical protein
MSETQISPLQHALETVEALPPDDQQLLIEITQNRLVELRRSEIAKNAGTTLQAVRNGHARYGSIEDLKRDLSSE